MPRSLEQTVRRLERSPQLPPLPFLISILQLCRRRKCLAHAQRLHAHARNHGLEAHQSLANYIVPMLVECDALACAHQTFNRLPHRTEHSWTSLISGCVHCGHSRRALSLYQGMLDENVRASKYTLIALLQACSRLKCVDRGREIHLEITGHGFESDLFVANTLVDMYAKSGSLSEAFKVFEGMRIRDVVSWNALIGGFAEHGHGHEALKCFERMRSEGLSPDPLTCVYALKACSSIGAIDKGRAIHTEIIKKGFETDIFIGNTLVDMYVKCGSVSEAQEVFDKLAARDVVSWNILIAGFAEHGSAESALKCFQKMQLDGVFPDSVTFICTLKACSNLGDIDKAREMHMVASEKGFEDNPSVGNALVDMYAKCGSLAEAQDVFDKLHVRCVISWTALIAGFTEHGNGQKALKCFDQMQLEGISPNSVTLVCCLKACGSLGAIDRGQEIHSLLAQKGFETSVSVGNTLIDMYAKCGSLQEAEKVFENLPVRDVVSWNAMINGYGMHHKGSMALQCFLDMQEQGVKPNAVTFTCLLTACDRIRLLLKGKKYFNEMREVYGIIPTAEHCTSMVNLLACSGNLHEADKFIDKMPFSPSIESWKALLSSCKMFAETEIGLKCFQHLVQVHPEDAASYVLMTDIYVNAGRRDEARSIEKLRKLARANKEPAMAVIEVDKKVYKFCVGNSQGKEISAMLEILISQMEEEVFVPNLDVNLRPISSEEKEAALCEHAEKLAVAFGLLCTPHRKTLHVTKNLRMCNNCHSASEAFSRIEKREIIIRDSYCIHHFRDGLCSCTAAL